MKFIQDIIHVYDYYLDPLKNGIEQESPLLNMVDDLMSLTIDNKEKIIIKLKEFINYFEESIILFYINRIRNVLFY